MRLTSNDDVLFRFLLLLLFVELGLEFESFDRTFAGTRPFLDIEDDGVVVPLPRPDNSMNISSLLLLLLLDDVGLSADEDDCGVDGL